MVQKGGKDTEKIRPPAYPQVEFLQDVQESMISCRHCGDQIDGDIWDALTKKDVDAIRKGDFRKWTHPKCGNIIKIVLQYGVD